MVQASARRFAHRKWFSSILALTITCSLFGQAFAAEEPQPADAGIQNAEAPSGEEGTVTSAVYGVHVSLTGPATLPAGETAGTVLQVTIDGVPAENPEGVLYESANPEVAMISETGQLEARSPGEAVISATFGSAIGQFKLQVDEAAGEQAPDRLLAKNALAGTLELEDRGFVALTPFHTVQQVIDGVTLTKSLSDVMVGARNATYFFNSVGSVYKIVLNGETPVDAMRVGIRRSIANIADDTQFNHPQIDFVSASGIRVVDKKGDAARDIPAGASVTFKPIDQQIAVLTNGAEVLRTANRLYVEPAAPGGLIQAKSFTRAQGNPSYRGIFEISLTLSNTALKLINEVNMEQYLYQVVPSEMPASFGLEALRAQAVAARTYALTDYESNRFADRGFHIDDSTLSQVYNNSAEHPLTTQAVNDTSGIIMTSGGELVDARFYSTSSGYGASKHEVWSDFDTNAFPGVPIPYLTARSYTYDPNDPDDLLEIDTQDEAQLLAFFKNLSFTGYDSESYYFRWKVSLNKTELENTINANLAGRQLADPNFVLTLQPDGSFASQPIPAAGIGAFKNMYVAKRGAGGNMMELVVEGTTGTYKIIKEYNIRFTIRPTKTYTRGNDVILHRAKGGSTQYDAGFQVRNPSILNSAFASFEIERDAAGEPTGVTFYGGGNGHGVGMSQYGASMLGGKGWSYDQILTSYYSGMQLTKVNGTVLSLERIEAAPIPTLRVGESKAAAIAGVYSDGSRAAIVSGAAFSSSRPSVATVDAAGLVTAKGSGSATITVSYGGKETTIAVVVTGAPAVERLELEAPARLWIGDQARAVVTAFYSDDTSSVVETGAVFSSANPEIVSVDAEGTLTAVALGSSTICVQYQGASATVEIEIVPVPALVQLALEGKEKLIVGETDRLIVTGTYEDGSTRILTEGIVFESKQPKTASVGEDGIVTALKPGSTLIGAEAGGITASYRILITPK